MLLEVAVHYEHERVRKLVSLDQDEQEDDENENEKKKKKSERLTLKQSKSKELVLVKDSMNVYVFKTSALDRIFTLIDLNDCASAARGNGIGHPVFGRERARLKCINWSRDERFLSVLVGHDENEDDDDADDDDDVFVVLSRVGRRVLKVDLRDLRRSERVIGGFVSDRLSSSSSSSSSSSVGDGNQKMKMMRRVCVFVERERTGVRGSLRRMFSSWSKDEKKKRRKCCELECRYVDIDLESSEEENEAVVLSQKMRRVQMKNVEGFLKTFGFEYDCELDSVTIVGKKDEDFKTHCVTMYDVSFASSSSNFVAIASGSFQQISNNNDNENINYGECSVSVAINADDGCAYLGIFDSETQKAQLWKTTEKIVSPSTTDIAKKIDNNNNNGNEIDITNRIVPIGAALFEDSESDKIAFAAILSKNLSAYSDVFGKTTIHEFKSNDPQIKNVLFKGAFAFVSGIACISNNNSNNLRRVCVLESFPDDDQSWRIVTIDEQTPQEMYMKYLDAKCWDEALELATKYDDILDANSTHKKKWLALIESLHKNSNKNNDTPAASKIAPIVIETLSSISDRSWVVAECLLQLAPTYELQRLLLSRVIAETEKFKTEDANVQTLWWLQARIAAFGALDRLETLRAMHLGNFSSSAYESFRFFNYVDAAKAVALAGNVRALEILLQRHKKEFYRNPNDLLDILGEIPECTNVEEYGRLLVETLDDFDKNGNGGGAQNHHRAPDWCEHENITKFILEHYNNDNNNSNEKTFIVERLDEDDKARHTIKLCMNSFIESGEKENAKIADIGDWVVERAFEIDERVGSILNARDFLAKVAKSSSRCIEDESIALALQNATSLCEFVLNEDVLDSFLALASSSSKRNDSASENDDIPSLLKMRVQNVSLREFHAMSLDEKVSLLLNEVDTTIDNVWVMLDVVTQNLGRADSSSQQNMMTMEELLQDWLISIAFDMPTHLDYFSYALEWFTKDECSNAKLYLGGSLGIDRVVTEIVHSLTRVDKRSIVKLKSIFSGILVIRGHDHDKDDDDPLMRLIQFVDATEVVLVRKNTLDVSMRELSEACANEAFARELLSEILEEEKIRKLNDSGWLKLFKDINALLKGAFSKVEYREDSGILLFALKTIVRSQLRNHAWSAAKIHILRSENAILSSTIPILRSREHALPLLLEVAKDFSRSALSVDDAAVVNSEIILRMVPLDPETSMQYPEVLEELFLIDTLRKLSAFNVYIAPIEFENARESQESIILSCLSDNPKNYLRFDELVDVGECLGIETKRVELMCAEYAYSAYRDFQASARMALRLISCGYSECWRLCAALGSKNGNSKSNVLTAKTRLSLLSFAVSHCPVSQVHGLLDEWQRTELENSPSELYDLGLKGIEASDEMLVKFLHEEEPTMLMRIDELAKFAITTKSKTQHLEEQEEQFPKLPQLACAKSLGYLAMINDPNLAGDAVDELVAAARSGRALRILLSLGFFSRAARALDDVEDDNDTASFASANMSDLTSALQRSGTVDAKLAGKYRSRVHAMKDAETLAFLLGREIFDASTFVAADDTTLADEGYGYRAKSILALAGSGIQDSDLSRLPNSSSEEDNDTATNSSSLSGSSSVLKLCLRLAETHGVDRQDIYVARTEIFFRSNFENSEIILKEYADALRMKTMQNSTSSLKDLLARLAWQVVSNLRRVDVLKSYFKIASCDDALTRLDLFQELVPSLDVFQVFQSDGLLHEKVATIEISRLLANECALQSTHSPEFPNALSANLGKAFENSPISSETIFAIAVTTVLKETTSSRTGSRKKRSTSASRWEAACSALSFLSTSFLLSLLKLNDTFLGESSRELKITIFSDILCELETRTDLGDDDMVSLKSARQTFKNLEFVHEVESALPRLHPDKLEKLEECVDIARDDDDDGKKNSVAALLDITASWMTKIVVEPFHSIQTVARIYLNRTESSSSTTTLTSTMCANALEIALDENPFDSEKLENFVIKSLGNFEEIDGELKQIQIDTIDRLERFVGEAINENDRAFVVNILSRSDIPWISEVVASELLSHSVEEAADEQHQLQDTISQSLREEEKVVLTFKKEEEEEEEVKEVKELTKDVLLVDTNTAATTTTTSTKTKTATTPPSKASRTTIKTNVPRLFLIQSENCLKALQQTKKIEESDLINLDSAKAFIDSALDTIDDSDALSMKMNAIRDVLFLWEDIAPWAQVINDNDGNNNNVGDTLLITDSPLSAMWFALFKTNLLKRNYAISFAKDCVALSTIKLKKRKKQLFDADSYSILSETETLKLLFNDIANDNDNNESSLKLETAKLALLLPYDSARKQILCADFLFPADGIDMDREFALALVSVKSALMTVLTEFDLKFGKMKTTNDHQCHQQQVLLKKTRITIENMNESSSPRSKFLVRVIKNALKGEGAENQAATASLYYIISVLYNDFREYDLAANVLFTCLRVSEAFRNPDTSRLILKRYLSRDNLKKFCGSSTEQRSIDDDEKKNKLNSYSSSEVLAIGRIKRELLLMYNNSTVAGR